ncbi:hypothetical protein UlMin_014768 [Ulmus minor]
MGCASSKQKRCRHCQNPYSPMVRSYSMHVHHPPVAKDDSYHLVALTSSTLGSLRLDSSNEGNSHIDGKAISNWFDRRINAEEEENVNVEDKQSKSRDFSVGLIEAKTWSNMINEKIPKIVPKTPIRTPPGEPETINTWELMEGLEDISPFRSPIHQRSFSFDVVRDPNPIPVVPLDRPKSKLQENGTGSPKPIWLQLADEGDSNSNIPEFDPDIISNFRKSLDELSPENGFHREPSDNDHEEEEEEEQSTASDDSSLDMKMENNLSTDQTFPNSGKEKEKLVLYFTSLRGVRKTYEDCCHVRVILKTIGVRVDERDVSMHSGFKDELKELLKEGFYTGGLPRVFLGKSYIGGAEEIRRLHEDGQLEKLLECCEKIADGGCDGGGACEACGDIRFVPCETCSGSCKIYYEEDDDDEEEEEEEEEEGDKKGYGFQRCPDCNENGLVRCPICCY